MKLRWKILIGVGIFIVLLAASLSVTMHVQPESELGAYKKSLRDKGEKLEFSEVIPPPTAPEDNARSAVEDAFGMLAGNQNVPNGMRMVAPGRAMVGWGQPDARNSDFTNSWEDFGAGIAANSPAIDLLHQVLVRPKLDFQLDYSKGTRMLVPQLAPMKRSAQMLDAAAIYELHNGDPGAASTNIITLLVLVHKDSADGLLISHLVRIAMTAIAIGPTWELLQSTNVNDSQLGAVQNAWQRMDFLSDAENSFVMERIWMSVNIEKSRASHEGFKDTVSWTGSGGFGGSSGGSTWSQMLEDFTQGPRSAAGEAMWRSSWSYSAEMLQLQSGQIVLDAVRAMQTSQTHFYKTNLDTMSSRLSSLGFTNTGGVVVHALKIPDLREEFGGYNFLGNVLAKTLRMETARDVVVTAIALKRFQLKHGKWPDTLGLLVPEFLPSVPIDPYDGKLLKYRSNTDGTFLLYSIGDDGMDDGGDTTPVRPTWGTTIVDWQRTRDWVWPQPATPAEVQYYYEHPPK
jgi:hypothetical protein